MQPEAKAQLGRRGAELVQDGQIVLLDGGTTHPALVRALRPELRAKVVTHGPTIAAALEPFGRVEVIQIGGTLLRLYVMALGVVALGVATAEAFGRISADFLFLGVTGVHPGTGLTTCHPEEAALKSRLMRRGCWPSMPALARYHLRDQASRGCHRARIRTQRPRRSLPAFSPARAVRLRSATGRPRAPGHGSGWPADNGMRAQAPEQDR